MARSRGFTMVEMVVAVAIVAVLSAIAVPVFLRQAPETNLREAASDVAAMVRYARSTAVTGATAGGTFPPDAVELRFDDATGEISAVAMGTGAPGILKVLHLDDYHPGDLVMTSARPMIMFRRNGGADFPTTVQLTERITGKQRTVEITRAGLARVRP